MRLLLDTHVWLWRQLEPERVSEAAERAISDPEADPYLSPVSTLETLVLARKRRLTLAAPAAEWIAAMLRRSALASAPVTHEIAIRSEQLDGLASADPADRLLVATALERGLTLVTADDAIQRYKPVATLW